MSNQQNFLYEGDPNAQLAARMGGIAIRDDGYSSPQRGNRPQNPIPGANDYANLPTPTGRGPLSPYTNHFQYYDGTAPIDPGYGEAGMQMVDPAAYGYGMASVSDFVQNPIAAVGGYTAFQSPAEPYVTRQSIAPPLRSPHQGLDHASLPQSSAMIRQPYRPATMSQQSHQQQAVYQQQPNATATLPGFYNYQDQNGYWTTQGHTVFVPQNGNQKQEAPRHNSYPSRRQQSTAGPRSTRQNTSNNHAGNNYNSPIHNNFAIGSPLTSSLQGYNNGSALSFGMYSGGPMDMSSMFGSRKSYRGGMGYVMRPMRFDVPGIRSALLEDYKLNRLRKWQLADVFGHLVEFSNDQHGSRFIQQKLEDATDDERVRFFDEILPEAFKVMTAVFGNYVTQKMFDLGNEEQKRALAKKMEGKVVQLSMHTYGCRVVQKALDNLQQADREPLIAELEPQILNCVRSPNANHVIQRLIALGPPKTVPNAFVGHISELCKDPYGCRVLQKTFEHLDHDIIKPLYNEVERNTLELMKDQFGNYVVQSVILTSNEADRTRIVENMKGNILGLARHKFASNVLEKAITASGTEDRHALIAELIGARPDGTDNIGLLLRDAFGNFPLQTAMISADPSQRQEIINIVSPILPQIRHTPVGKRIEGRLAQIDRPDDSGSADPVTLQDGLHRTVSSAGTSETNGLSMSRTTSSSTGPTSPELMATPTPRAPKAGTSATATPTGNQKGTKSPQGLQVTDDAQALVDLLQ